MAARFALGGNIGAAEVLTILVLAARSADPLLSLAEFGGRLRGARAELARLDAVLRTEPLPEPRVPVEPEHHDLEFDSAVFRHGDRTVVDDVSLSVPQGQRLAVVRRGRARARCCSCSPGSTTWTRARCAWGRGRAGGGDRIAFLDGGRIVEHGSHELLRLGGRYADSGRSP